MIVDDPNEPGGYDAEWIVMLDDWTDGIGHNPQQIYDDLRAAGIRMGGMGMGHGRMGGAVGACSDLLGGDAGDISYPLLPDQRAHPAPHRPPSPPSPVSAFGSASSTPAPTPRSGSHWPGTPMTVTHTDGYPVVPVEVDALLIGMGERYDVVVTAADGVFPLVALAEGKNALARALLSHRCGHRTRSRHSGRRELDRRVGTVDTFTAAPRRRPGPGDARR